MGSIEAQMLTQMAYETMYGVHDHITDESPLALVSMHPTEQYNQCSGLYRAIERYEFREIGEFFKISLEEYLSLPTSIVTMIDEIAANLVEERSKLTGSASNEANKESEVDARNLLRNFSIQR